MNFVVLGKVSFDIKNKIIKRKPTLSNLLETSGSDNDLYLGNVNQLQVVESICKIFGISSIDEFLNKNLVMDFYDIDVEIKANINNQGRINLRVYGKNRLYGMLKYYKMYCLREFNENNYIVLDFNKMQIFIE